MKIICVETKEQFDTLLGLNLKELSVGEIYVAYDTFIADLDNLKVPNGVCLGLRLPRIGTGTAAVQYFLSHSHFDMLMIRNIDELAFFTKCIAKIRDKSKISKYKICIDWSLNVYNNETKNTILSMFDGLISENNISFTYCLEENVYELSMLSLNELLVYGYVPVMVSENCVLKTTDRCTDKKVLYSDTSMKDRKNETIHIRTYCKECYNQILNPYPIYLLDMQEELRTISYQKERFDFTIENKNELINILQNQIRPKNFTRGHIKRGIE